MIRTGPDDRFMRGGAANPGARQREAAETLAIEALGFLAGDDERLERFLSLSGLDPSTLRDAAGDPGFLPSILSYLLADEPLLLVFAEHQRIDPARVASAFAALGGAPPSEP